jgi:MFS family permease
MPHSQQELYLALSCELLLLSLLELNTDDARGGFTMDSLGRRKTIMVGAMINLVGAVLQSSAQNLAMVLVGRILAGWAVGVLSMSVPVYQSECAHPKTRGM